MKLAKILELEGIVIRKIPKETVRYWTAKETDKGAMLNHRGRWVTKEVKQNSLGGKYLIQFASDQSSQVRFNLKSCGIGGTIEEAYSNYMEKI